uniref:Uncharacterized protein n=1 Tax=Rhizophora mucronata TaxID=61149 RepID=A0A2P2N4F0_RHIMU
MILNLPWCCPRVLFYCSLPFSFMLLVRPYRKFLWQDTCLIYHPNVDNWLVLVY